MKMYSVLYKCLLTAGDTELLSSTNGNNFPLLIDMISRTTSIVGVLAVSDAVNVRSSSATTCRLNPPPQRALHVLYEVFQRRQRRGNSEPSVRAFKQALQIRQRFEARLKLSLASW